MAYISQLKYENAPEKTKRVIDEWVAAHGPLTNMKETLIHSLPAFHALMEWFPLEEEINFAFTEEEQLLIDYGRAIVKDANHVPAEIFTRLKQKWSEEQIVAITAFATIMIATNLINKTLQVELDEELVPYTKRK